MHASWCVLGGGGFGVIMRYCTIDDGNAIILFDYWSSYLQSKFNTKEITKHNTCDDNDYQCIEIMCDKPKETQDRIDQLGGYSHIQLIR